MVIHSYIESVVFIYSQNIFSTASIGCIICLPSCIGPTLFDNIRSLNLRWSHNKGHYSSSWPGHKIPSGYEATWETACAVLASMKGLKSLRVHMSEGRFLDYETESQLLGPLTSIQRCDLFIVTTSWTLKQGVPAKYENQHWPFQIQRGIPYQDESNALFEEVEIHPHPAHPGRRKSTKYWCCFFTCLVLLLILMAIGMGVGLS